MFGNRLCRHANAIMLLADIYLAGTRQPTLYVSVEERDIERKLAAMLCGFAATSQPRRAPPAPCAIS